MKHIYRGGHRNRCVYVVFPYWTIRFGRHRHPLFSERYGYVEWRYYLGGRISVLRRRREVRGS
jgi:hypothetical protein